MGRKSRSKRERSPVESPEVEWRWYHPVLFGAGFLFCIVLLRLLWLLPALLTRADARREAFLVLGAGTAAGALGGLGYALLGAPLRRIPGIGRYLAGIVTVGSYLGAVAGATWLTDEPMLTADDPARWIAFGLAVTFFGILVGRRWFDEPAPPDT